MPGAVLCGRWLNVRDLPGAGSGFGDVLMIFLDLGETAEIFSSKTGQRYSKATARVCDSSTSDIYELCAVGDAAGILDSALSQAQRGDVFVARCVYKEDVGSGYRIALCKHSSVSLSPGLPEDPSRSLLF